MTIPTPPELLKLADELRIYTDLAVIPPGVRASMIESSHALRHSASASTAGRGEVVAYCGWHPKHGYALQTCGYDEQHTTSLLMQTDIAGNHGWSVRPLYASPPAAETAGVEAIHEACEKCPNTGWCWGSGACQNTGTPLATLDDTSAPVVGGGLLLMQARYVLKNLHVERPDCGYDKLAAACESAALAAQGKADAGRRWDQGKHEGCGKCESAPT